MLFFRAPTLCGAVFILSACGHLQEVRDFASESAQLATYTRAVDHTLGSYSRSEPYLFSDVRAKEKVADATRQESRDSLIGLHKLSSTYMATLAKLAGADTFSLDTNIDKVAKSIKAAPDIGIQGVTVDAYANLVRTLSKWVLEAAQEKAVHQMIRDGGGDFEKVVSGMGDVVRIFRKIHDNEKRSVLDGLDLMIATTKDTAENYLILSLAKDRLNQKREEYIKGDALYDAALKDIKAIQDGHHTMKENLDRLDAKEVRDKLKQLRDDIKRVREALATAGV